MPENALPPAAPSPARPRKAGAHAARPRLAVDMVRIVAVARAASAWYARHTDGPGVTDRDLVAEIGAAVGAATRVAPLRRTAVGAAHAALAQRQSRRRVECSVGHGEGCVDALTAELTATWESTRTDAALEATIAALTAEGFDAERLCWWVVAAESLRHEKLVWRQANRLAAHHPNTTAEELLGYGWQGLRIALRSYDPERCLLATYAVPRINGAIRDGVRAEHHLPKRLVTMQRKLKSIDEALCADLGRIPTLTEVAERFGADANQRGLMTRLSRPASIDAWFGADQDRSADPAWLTDDADVAADALNTLHADAIADALGELPADEADAVRLLVLEEVPLSEAAARRGVPPRQMSARRRRGLDKLAVLLAEFAPATSAA